MKKCISLLCFIFSINICIAQQSDKKAIELMLQQQVIGWNEGNLEKFMIGYWESDSLVFIGKNGPKYGYKTTLDNYKKSYPDTATMGKLTTTLLQINKLSPTTYFVIGKWFLKRTIGDVGGHYTLLIKKIKNKWVVVADHSS